MTQVIDFYFDFSSPYGYLAAQKIEAVAARHEATVNWRPFLLGAVLKLTGAQQPLEQPIKGVYLRYDLERSARELGVHFQMPERFPFGTIAACRAFYLVASKDADGAVRLAKAIYRAAFAEGKDICPVETVVAIAAETGFDGDDILEHLQRPEIKDVLKREVAAAIARGVCGSPYFFVGDEPFWGQDRLAQIETFLASGGGSANAAQ